MVESEDSAQDDFETTALVRINPKEATLPIDTSAEWTKGFILVNKLIKELADVRYTESYIDEVGDKRSRMVLHPQLLGYIQERRKMIDQIWKVSGGEVVNEGKKEAIKNMARILFETQIERKTKEKYRDDVINILEVDVNDES
jgi:hypothetical protein